MDRYNEAYDMYVPKGGKSRFTHRFNGNRFNFSRFLKKYVYFRIPRILKPYSHQFLVMFIIGIVLNYVYYGIYSLKYLFIGGVNEWFNILISSLNYGIGLEYNLLYLIINGIFYAYFYHSFILFIYKILLNLENRNTWIMLAWFIGFWWLIINKFPQVI